MSTKDSESSQTEMWEEEKEGALLGNMAPEEKEEPKEDGKSK